MLNTNYQTTNNVSTSNLAKIIDEFALLHHSIKQFEPTLKRYEQLKKQLAAEADNFGDGEVRLQGSTSFALFTKPPQKRTLINIPSFLKAVGINKFLECISVSVTKADKLLNESQKATLFKTEAGARRLKDAGTYGDLIASAVESNAQTRH